MQPSTTCRILLVEDEASDAHLLQQSLKRVANAAFEITWVKTLGEARQHLAGNAPDVVLLDLTLPDSSGLDTVHAGRVAAGALPLIVLTGNNDAEFALRTLEAGAQDYLVKGEFEVDDLNRAIRYAISRAKLEQRLYEAEERWRFALEGAGDGVWDWDIPSGRVQYSWRLKEMLGLDDAEMPNVLDAWQSRVHAEDKARVVGALQAYLGGQTLSYQSEHRVQCGNSEWKWVLHRGMVVSRDANGRPLRMIGTQTDIDKIKQAEQKLQRSEAFMRQTQQISHVGGWEFDVEAQQLRWTEETYRIYELPPGTDPSDVSVAINFYEPLDRAVLERAFKRVTESGEPYDLELKLVCANGVRKWVRTTGQAERVDDKITRVFGNIMDITKSKEAEEMLRLSNTVFNTVDEAILVSDVDNRIIMVNPAFARVTGYAPEDVIGGNPSILSSGKHSAEFYHELWRQITSRGGWSGELWNRRKSGEVYVVWTSIKQVRDSHGKLTHYVAAFSDITIRKANEESIRHQAQYDALTDLPNRVLLFDRLQQALAQAKRDKTRLALMFVDLDKFKPINDNLGHSTGDQILQEVAKRMQDCVREMDTVARIGGDEFVVLLPVVESERDAQIVAEKIRVALNHPFNVSGQMLNISSSTGIAIYPEHGTNEDQLTGNADIAMYNAKESGRNKVVLFHAGMRVND